MLNCRDTFLMGLEDEQDLHLRIIVNSPTENGEVVLVSVTTKRKKSELLVQLTVGDHPWLRHDSVIAYRYSIITDVTKIENALHNGYAVMQAPVSPQLLKRAQRGLLESDFTPNEVRYFFQSISEATD